MKRLHIKWLVICLNILLLQSYALQPGVHNPILGDFVKNECLITFKPGLNKSYIDSISYLSKFTILAYYPYGRFYRIKIPADQEVHAYALQLSQYPGVDLAQPDYYIATLNYTTDSLTPLQWTDGDISPESTYKSPIPDSSKSISDNCVIGIIGSGIAFENYQQFKKAHALLDIRFFNGFNFITNDEHPNDDIGNGTLVTTIISNLLKNVSDNTNALSRSSIMPVKVIDKHGNGRTSNLVEGILFAVNNGASILDISVKGPDSPLLRQAVVKAFNHGTTIICAAGDAKCPKSLIYPAAYNQYCIAAAANDYGGVQISSGQHSDYIDLSAPGEIHYNNTAPVGYSIARGTSIAAAHVTATAVLLKLAGIDGNDRIRQAFEQSCTDLPPRGWDWQTGWGILDVQKALQFFPRLNHDIKVTNFKVSPWCIKGEHLQTITSVTNQGNFEHDISLSLTDVQTSRIVATASGSIKPHQSSQFIMEWNTGYEVVGAHILCVSANISGDEDPADNVQYKKVLVTEDHRDVEISGVEFNKQSEKNSFLANIQIKNNGTYHEIIHIRVKDSSGALIGQYDTQICAQCILYLPVQCQKESCNNACQLNISIETADMQESNLTNNKATYPLIFSE